MLLKLKFLFLLTFLNGFNTLNSDDYFEGFLNTIPVTTEPIITKETVPDVSIIEYEAKNDNDDGDDDDDDYENGTKDNYENYCKISMNDLVIPLTINHQNSLLAYYNDDLLFECEFPEDLSIRNFTWILNNKKMESTDSTLNIAIDKNVYNSTNDLSVICKFILNTNLEKFTKFPVIKIDKYIFKNEIEEFKYLITYKYHKVLFILKVNFLITCLTAVTFIILSAILFLKSKNRTQQLNSSSYVPVET